ncbi:MAG: DUF4974 domain-containing protein, partial [Bacteroidota bacterium]|nr:DUF4974 domain-containing protein [Bacteroidota bacterium]
GNTREVSIEGEAFFEVSHNPKMPFIIHAAGSRIKVLGTSFNVKAYSKTNIVEVIVKSGKVQFLHDDTLLQKDKTIVLASGDKGVYEKSSGKIQKQHNYDVNYIAWLTKSLDFRDTPLEEVIEKISEVYQVQIIIEDKSLKDYRLNAQFEQKTLSHILQVIELTFDIKAEHKNGTVVLKKRGS